MKLHRLVALSLGDDPQATIVCETCHKAWAWDEAKELVQAVADPAGMVNLRDPQVSSMFGGCFQKRDKAKCWGCRVEMSSYLDAYYGSDARLARMCARCRDNITYIEGPNP